MCEISGQMSIFDFPECIPSEICSHCALEGICKHNKDYDVCGVRVDKTWNTSEYPKDRDVHILVWKGYGMGYELSTTREPISGQVVAWKDIQEWEK